MSVSSCLSSSSTWLSLYVTNMADFWGMSFFLSLEDDDIFYPILWIMLNIALFAFMTALWNWKVGVRAGAEPGAAAQGGGSEGSGPSAGLGWGPAWEERPCPSGAGQARLGVPGQAGAGPGCAMGCGVPLRLLGMLPSHLLLSVPIQEERQRKCQHGGNREDSRGAPHPLALSPLPTVWDFHSSSQHARMLMHICEQLFSRMKYKKSKISSKISDKHHESSLRTAPTAIKPD
ncbi:uncharacterized protein LOC128083549 [Tympanuchus pallidicinctus]|uniref:uncharacterized protein LOC128083549 n=1 Tax=Tympanuchus pallidicinctus TaxID=109042 RepID=UPI00228718F0|nr:uncharacterized protein LOC128083549 [Tympanuchus pallidicinctus]